jgi:hypothetical protein
VLISTAFVASWPPADVVALDVFAFDALAAAHATDPRVPLLGPTARAWRVEDEWMVIRERPLPKVGNPAEQFVTWVQENESDSGGEESRYLLELRLTQGLVPPA